jgi:DNA-binding NarL/FixJ family response regulator
LRRLRESNRGHVVEKLELAPREAQTLRLLSEGYTNQQIAMKMRISVNTVKTRLQTIMGHVGARKDRQLIAWAHRNPGALQGLAVLADHEPECTCWECGERPAA